MWSCLTKDPFSGLYYIVEGLTSLQQKIISGPTQSPIGAHVDITTVLIPFLSGPRAQLIRSRVYLTGKNHMQERFLLHDSPVGSPIDGPDPRTTFNP